MSSTMSHDIQLKNAWGAAGSHTHYTNKNQSTSSTGPQYQALKSLASLSLSLYYNSAHCQIAVWIPYSTRKTVTLKAKRVCGPSSRLSTFSLHIFNVPCNGSHMEAMHNVHTHTHTHTHTHNVKVVCTLKKGSHTLLHLHSIIMQTICTILTMPVGVTVMRGGSV